MSSGFDRFYDEKNELVGVMCPACFTVNEPVSAREGGKLSTKNGDTYDICILCTSNEWLIFAAMMGA